jgi:hypothetical protein
MNTLPRSNLEAAATTLNESLLMPFPLAHPAAVLLFRRHCPRLLSWPALIVGSLIPDAGYLGKSLQLDEISHRLSGLLTFCLPIGVVTVLFFYAVRSRLFPIVPNPFRRIFAPLFQQPAASLREIAFSVLLGAATHLLWDSFTHKNGSLVGRLPILETPIAQVGSRQVLLCHLFWYVSTLGGVAWLGSAYQQWRSTVRRSPLRISFRVRWTNAFLLGFLVVPVAMIHHLVHGLAGAFLVASLSAFLMLGFVWWVETQFEEKARAPAG